jgi:hypothetical protein
VVKLERGRLFKGKKALKSRLERINLLVESFHPTAREQQTSREVRLFEGRKTLEGEIPGTLESEKRFRGFGRRKPLRG